MKPRQRKPQKQSARLYARGNDHRDIIAYDDANSRYIYHNALYWTEEDDAKVTKEHIAWVKYPEHSVVATYGGASNQQGAHCVMDVDRQFEYGLSYAGGQRGRAQVYGLECGLTVIFTQYGGALTNFRISEDGVVWKDIDVQGANPYQLNLYHFGEDGLCWIAPGPTVYGEDYPYGNGFTFGIILFEKDEETDEWSVRTSIHSFTDRVNALEFVCNTKQGCIIYRTYGAPYDSQGTSGAFNVTYWHIDHAGVKTEKKYDIWQTNPTFADISLSQKAYAKVGNRCFVALGVQNPISRYSTTRWFRTIVSYSPDNGATWTGQTLIEYYWGQEGWVDSINPRVNMFVRDGEVFVFASIDKVDGGKTRLFSTYTGTQWDEVALPSWVDLPVLQGGGACINPTPNKDTLRIAIAPLETSNYDVALRDMISDITQDTNLRSGSVMYKDGEMVKITDDEMWFMFGSFYDGGWCAFFDNRYLSASSRAFAWKSRFLSATSDIPDTVQPNDYCVRGE